MQWLRYEGVEGVYDVAFGADICTWAHLRYIEKNLQAKVLTQPCAVVVNYILKHSHKLLKNLSPIQSPMLCTAVYLRKYMGFKGKIAAISPCIAKRDEFHMTGLIDYNVTMEHLKKYFDENGIVLPKVKLYSEFEFDVEQGLEGRIYPKPGGLKKYAVPQSSEVNGQVREMTHNLKEVICHMDGLKELNTVILDGMQDINVNVNKFRKMSESVEKIAKDISGRCTKQ